MSLTIEQAYAATSFAEKQKYNEVSAAYNKATAIAKTGRWTSITTDQRTAILDVAYNFGQAGLERNQSGQLWQAMVSHDWSTAGDLMLTSGMQDTRAEEDRTRLGTTPQNRPASNNALMAFCDRGSFAQALFDGAFAPSGGVMSHAGQQSQETPHEALVAPHSRA